MLRCMSAQHRRPKRSSRRPAGQATHRRRSASAAGLPVSSGSSQWPVMESCRMLLMSSAANWAATARWNDGRLVQDEQDGQELLLLLQAALLTKLWRAQQAVQSGGSQTQRRRHLAPVLRCLQNKHRLQAQRKAERKLLQTSLHELCRHHINPPPATGNASCPLPGTTTHLQHAP